MIEAKASNSDTLPHISVVIPTRNRERDVQQCLQSLVNMQYDDWDLLVLDQSDDESTRDQAQSFAKCLPMMRYHRLSTKGLSRARNYAMGAATGEIIAFLDDDCTVESDWLQQIADVFARHPEAAIIFGAVDAAPGTDLAEVYVPTYEIKQERTLCGVKGLRERPGIGASMYVRRAHSLPGGVNGPFDVFLGPGVRAFPAADEIDYAYRALIAGHEIVNSPSIRVIHYGARGFKDGGAGQLLRGYLRANGAAHMKLLRCGKRGALLLILREAWATIRTISIKNLVNRRGQTGFAQSVMYAWGLCSSFRLAVDRKNCLYRRR